MFSVSSVRGGRAPWHGSTHLDFQSLWIDELLFGRCGRPRTSRLVLAQIVAAWANDVHLREVPVAVRTAWLVVFGKHRTRRRGRCRVSCSGGVARRTARCISWAVFAVSMLGLRRHLRRGDDRQHSFHHHLLPKGPRSYSARCFLSPRIIVLWGLYPGFSRSRDGRRRWRTGW